MASDPSIRFTQTLLSNGLRLIVSEDHTAPVVSVALVYDVGSRNERQGQSGLAHLFERYWRAVLTTRTDSTAPALRELLFQIQRMSEDW